MNAVVHFEMPYEDAARVMEFYKKALGWDMTLFANMGDYVTATTAETKNGRPTQPGTINGGFWKKDESKPAQVPSFVVAVEDIEVAMTAVKAAGGEILGDPVDIPTVGRYVSFYDTEGNRVSLLQPAPRG